MIIKSCFLLLAIMQVLAYKVNFKPCPGIPAPLVFESINNECTDERCYLIRGRIWRARMMFVPQEDMSALRVAIFLPFPLVWPIGRFEDACHYLFNDAQCPVIAKQVYEWDVHIVIDGTTPVKQNVPFRCEFLFHSSDQLNLH